MSKHNNEEKQEPQFNPWLFVSMIVGATLFGVLFAIFAPFLIS